MSFDPPLKPSATALVLIDLEPGIVSRDVQPHPAQTVVQNCIRLSDALRKAGGTVVFVHVDLNGTAYLPADKPRQKPASPPPASASELLPELNVQPQDIVVLKRQWGAFYNTDLEEQLRSKGIETVIMGGIATNFGVETTARDAMDRRFALLFAKDACSSISAEMHRFAMEQVFPVMGRVRSTQEIVSALAK